MKRTLKKHQANRTRPAVNKPTLLTEHNESQALSAMLGPMSPARLSFVGLVAQLCRQQSEGYNGGLWEFYRLPDSTACYAVLNGAKPEVIMSPNGYSFEATPEIAGLCWSIAALALMTNQFQCLKSYSAWKALKKYSQTLPDAQHIHWFLD